MLSFMPQILYALKSKLLPVFVGMALCLSAFSPAAAAEISSLRIGQGIGNTASFLMRIPNSITKSFCLPSRAAW